MSMNLKWDNVSPRTAKARAALVAALDLGLVTGLTKGYQRGWDAIESEFAAITRNRVNKREKLWQKRTRLYYRILVVTGADAMPELIFSAYSDAVESDIFPMEEIIKLGRIVYGACAKAGAGEMQTIRDKILEIADFKLNETAQEILRDLL